MRHHSSQVDLIEISTTHHSSCSQTRTSHDDPDHPGLNGGLGRDDSERTRQVGRHPEATETMVNDPQPPLRAFLEHVSAQ